MMKKMGLMGFIKAILSGEIDILRDDIHFSDEHFIVKEIDQSNLFEREIDKEENQRYYQ